MIKEEERERYRELLEELRTIIPGAQVLFAFLLTVPFAARFSLIDAAGKILFTISILAVAAATVLFLAPAAYHRLASRRDRLARLRFGVRSTLAGMFLLALSITLAVFVVVRFLFESTRLGAIVAAAAALLVVLLWYVLPIVNRSSSGDISEAES
jgi:hypothetical protein